MKTKPESLDEAEAAFYSAFESGDIKAMKAIWLDDDDIACIHPHGPRLVGVAAVMNGWRQILDHSSGMTLEVTELKTTRDHDLAVRMVVENISINNDNSVSFSVFATNVYRRTADGWRLVLHHASPNPASLEKNDQADEKERKEKTTLH